jgi:hypothetical protein
MVTFTGALATLILALLEGAQNGWGSPLNIAAYVLCAALLVSFIVVETRQFQPMFDISLFRQPQFVSLCVAVVSLVFGFTPLLVLPAELLDGGQPRVDLPRRCRPADAAATPPRGAP